MPIKKFRIQFAGQTTIQFDTDEFPHYANGKKGLAQLAEDHFYDEADLRFSPFVDGSTEFYDAYFEEVN